MKKKIALLTAILMTVSLSACAGNDTPVPVSISNVTEQSQESTVSVGGDVKQNSSVPFDNSWKSTESSAVSVSGEDSSSSDSSTSDGSVSDTVSSSSENDGSVVSSAQTSVSSDTSQSSTKEPSADKEVTSVPSAEPSKQPSVEVSAQVSPTQSSVQSPSKTESSKTESSKTEFSKTESVPVQQSSQTSVQPQTSHAEVSTPDTPKTPDNPTADENDIGGIALYNELFNIQNKVSVSISMDKSEIDKLQADYNKYTARDENAKSEIYRKASVTFTVGSEKYTLDEVGIRLKGNQSIRPFYASDGTPNICSFKLSFDETFDDKEDYGSAVKVWTDDNARKARKKRKFATLNELDIKWNISYDNTNIREIYATKLFESANVLVQKIGLSQMVVNGNNYGLVKIYEPIDKTFLEKRLPESAIGGDLYKCMWSECNNNGVRTGSWRGATYKTNNSYGVQQNAKGIKYNFNLKTNKNTSKHESLKNFLNVINKSNITKDELEKILDVDYYANFMAAEYFAGDPDDIRNNYNNHYIYFRKDNGKAIFIVYDNDRTLGITYGLNKNCATRNPYSSYAAVQGEQENPLIMKTISHQPLASLSYVRDKYSAALQKLSQTAMLTSDSDFNKMYNTAKSNYQSIITPYIWFGNQYEDFRFSLDGNKNGGDRANMSFEQFRSQIMDTYKNAQP